MTTAHEDSTERRVLIASIPRCGSTMLFHAVSGASRDRTSVRLTGSELPMMRFLKTHSLAPEKLPPDVRPVFLFGDPVAAVLSTRKKIWDRFHWRNCGWTGAAEPDMVTADDLGYERIYDSWTRPNSYPVLAVRYEAMWDYVDQIAEFCGVAFGLPERKARATRVTEREEVVAIRRTHRGLIGKVERAQDCELLKPK